MRSPKEIEFHGQITLNIPILYEDEDVLVINKPANIVVNRAESVKEATVQDWAKRYLHVPKVAHVPKVSNEGPEIKDDTFATFDTSDTFTSRSGTVHRIDKETSGCLIIAKNPESFSKLQASFKDHNVNKTYVALVHGKIVSQLGTVNVPIGRLPWNREQFGVVPGGKESVTRFKRIMNYELRIKNKTQVYTLVELYPQTGRTHQIRVHLKYLGYPIVGDYLYAGRKQQKLDRKWCPRVFLHAAKIEFPHPGTQKIITVESPLPEELKTILALLTDISTPAIADNSQTT